MPEYSALMDREAQQALQPQLLEDETLVWAGRPRQGFLFTLLDILAIPFSLVWCTFAFTWEGLAIFAGDNEEGLLRFLFILFGIPFVLTGVQMLIGRFFTDRRRRAHTFYGITNKRALVLEGVRRPRLHAYSPEELGDIFLSRKRRHYGDIRFGQWKFRPKKRGMITHWPYGIFTGFQRIEKAGQVFGLLEQLRDGKSEKKEPAKN